MFAYNSKYTKIALSVLLCVLFFLISISYFTIYSIVHHRRTSTAQVRSVQKQWSQRSDFREIVVPTSDGLMLKGAVFERENAQRIILGCHGYKKSKESLCRLVDLFPDDIIILFDFRAHGESDGFLVSFGYHERKDIAAVVSSVKELYKDMSLPLFGLGFSMGAASLIGAAADGVFFDGLVLNSSFASLSGQIAHVFGRETGLPHVPFMSAVTMLCPFVLGFELSDVVPAQWIKSVLCPVSIIHALDDPYVLVESAYALRANAYNLFDCWVMQKGGHRRAVSVCPEEYQARCESFFCAC